MEKKKEHGMGWVCSKIYEFNFWASPGANTANAGAFQGKFSAVQPKRAVWPLLSGGSLALCPQAVWHWGWGRGWGLHGSGTPPANAALQSWPFSTHPTPGGSLRVDGRLLLRLPLLGRQSARRRDPLHPGGGGLRADLVPAQQR